jgi:hypothetical protein
VIVNYMCDFCGRAFDNPTHCKTHEDKHLHPKRVEASTFSATLHYPTIIKVEMSDGSICCYTYLHEIQKGRDE